MEYIYIAFILVLEEKRQVHDNKRYTSFLTIEYYIYIHSDCLLYKHELFL